MKIIIQHNEKVYIKFQGTINMTQEVSLDREDAKKLGELLVNSESTSFDTVPVVKP